MPWELADRDHPTRAGSRYADLARASEECDRAVPAGRFYLRWIGATCLHCGRGIVKEGGYWIDPLATGDDSMWRETCDAHDTFTAEHEPSTSGGDA